MSRALKGLIPRGYKDHRSGSGRRYAAVCRAFAERFGGTVPGEARPLLKALGRLSVDLDRVHDELEAAVVGRRMKEARRYRRQLAGMNRDLLTFTARLEELARQVPADPMAAVRRAVQEANR